MNYKILLLFGFLAIAGIGCAVDTYSTYPPPPYGVAYVDVGDYYGPWGGYYYRRGPGYHERENYHTQMGFKGGSGGGGHFSGGHGGGGHR